MNKHAMAGFTEELEKLGMDPILAGILAGGLLGGGIGLVGAHTLADLILHNKKYMAALAGGAGAVAGGSAGMLLKSKLYPHTSDETAVRPGQMGVYGRGIA